MTEPAPYDPKVTPAVRIGGKLWPIPELAPRQLRMVRRSIIDLTNIIQPPRAEQLDGEDVAAIAASMVATGDRVLKLENADYGKMLDVVYYGLTRAHPSLTPEEFETWAIADAEVFRAFLVVRTQSNIYVQVEPGQKAKPPGEVVAESRTGT